MLCVLLCSRRLSAHSVFLVMAGCLGPCLCAPVLVLLVRTRWLALCLGVCLVLHRDATGGILFALLHLFLLLRLFVTLYCPLLVAPVEDR